MFSMKLDRWETEGEEDCRRGVWWGVVVEEVVEEVADVYMGCGLARGAVRDSSGEVVVVL
jgi:hypothetical protein